MNYKINRISNLQFNLKIMSKYEKDMLLKSHSIFLIKYNLEKIKLCKFEFLPKFTVIDLIEVIRRSDIYDWPVVYNKIFVFVLTNESS